MDKRFDKEVLRQYLKGEYSPADYRNVKGYFEEEGVEPELDNFISEDWRDFSEVGERKDLSFILQKIQRKIYFKKTTGRRSLWNYYRNVAAVLLLPIFLASTFLLINRSYTDQNSANSWAEIYSPLGARTQFMLPDGTSGWLNSGSSLKYPVNFETRKVQINGEAFFDVTHDKNKKFVVQTPDLDITVLGTKFNVAAYNDDDFMEVVLEEGKVMLNGKRKTFSESILPNERFVLYKDKKKGNVSTVEAKLFSSWKDGKLVFRDETLAEVLKKMERWYNVQFVIEDEELKGYVYQATFKDETLEEVMRLLAYTAPIRYEIQERVLKQDGTYSTKKIFIRK